MALTETEKERLLRAFYRERLIPVAEAARARGVKFFAVGAEAALESYYVERNDSGDYVHEIDADDLAGELRDLWDPEGFPELADLAGPIAALAETIKETDETPGDVSPFIYAMF